MRLAAMLPSCSLGTKEQGEKEARSDMKGDATVVGPLDLCKFLKERLT
jgi:hypothetical protein